MTREEAIEQLKWYFEYDNGLSADKETVEAYKMAIKALEQEPCEDAISRQAVLEYIEGSEAELGHSSENELVCQDIKELPSIALKPCDDCISRQEVLYLIADNDLSMGQVVRGIHALPSVTPQDPILDKIRAEIEQRPYGVDNDSVIHGVKIQGMKYERAAILKIINKHKTESEE